AVEGEGHKARLREPVADMPKRLCQSPPRMQDQHPWSAAMLGNGQIGADRSPISLKFSHCALLKQTHKKTQETLCFKKHSTDVLFCTHQLSSRHNPTRVTRPSSRQDTQQHRLVNEKRLHTLRPFIEIT